MVSVYGKHRCGKCEAACKKLESMGLQYTLWHLDDPEDGWRESKCTEARAMYEALVDEQPEIALPLIEIDNVIMTYPCAMKSLRVDKRR